MVPNDLRRRWTLILGDSRLELSRLLHSLSSSVDVFFHDSEHSYHHMMWEYTSVLPWLAHGGLLISDDISFNTAFWDFCAAAEAPWVIHRRNSSLGAMVSDARVTLEPMRGGQTADESSRSPDSTGVRRWP